MRKQNPKKNSKIFIFNQTPERENTRNFHQINDKSRQRCQKMGIKVPKYRPTDWVTKRNCTFHTFWSVTHSKTTTKIYVLFIHFQSSSHSTMWAHEKWRDNRKKRHRPMPNMPLLQTNSKVRTRKEHTKIQILYACSSNAFAGEFKRPTAASKRWHDKTWQSNRNGIHFNAWSIAIPNWIKPN